MNRNTLYDAVPGTFKTVETSKRYEFWCKECSFKHDVSKKLVRLAGWDSSFQMELSEQLEKHQRWHEQNPGKSYEEERAKRLKEASDGAVQMLNSFFIKMMRK